MTLSPAFLDELRLRTSLSSLVGRTVPLKRAGREYKACCPFHEEKTPSFTVSDEKGFYHCFGCAAHGDAISWLVDARGLMFMDAVKELADAAGMEVPAPDPKAAARSERAAGLADANGAAAIWFAEQLAGPGGKEARSYLKQRGLKGATIARFGFGFAPDGRSALRHALARFGDPTLLEAGLLVATQDNKEPYDRFRGRLIIPIRDIRGRIIGFGGRILGPGEPKYLNSPDTPLFDKGRSLYNLDRAAPAAREAKRAILVEGYMDVAALDETGISECVAPLGTALTEAQLGLLWRLSPTPLLCFDGDSAGRRAAARAALRALPAVAPGRSLAFVSLPPGQDPDDLIRARGRDAFEALLADAEPLIDLLWRSELEAGAVATPEEKAGLKQRLLAHASAIADPDVREEYRAEFLRRFGAFWAPAPARPQKAWTGPRGRFAPVEGPPSSGARAVGGGSLDDALALAALLGLARFPDLLGQHAEALHKLRLGDRRATQLRDAMIEAAMKHGPLDQERLGSILSSGNAADLLESLALRKGLAFSFTRRDADRELARRDLALLLETLAARPGIDAALAAATSRLKEAGDTAAFEEQQRLLRVRDETDRQLALLIEGA